MSKSTKKALRKEIEQKLFVSLTDLKQKVGEKKFNSHVKKASKLLASGVKEVKVKKAKAAAATTVVEAPVGS